MKIFLHICCAPCACFPIESLAHDAHEITGFWFNPNIHPFLEYRKRLSEVHRIARETGIALVENDSYSLVPFLRKVIAQHSGAHRCDICYELRLRETSKCAIAGGFECFSTTLLYSKHQRHERIRAIGESIAKELGLQFYYQDFRLGYNRGIELSRERNIYRQQYCGCVISEYERYHNCADKALEKHTDN